ncbi:MAG TPA: DUF5668 domain-containing protein [Syntrophales bacterium]|nr:DUF5668 domain-containing protein [Syntrophales bacterium]HOL59830.1 DUF5668 domain-containing protein [Syntrophales bacterium]HPO35952.1 DUF5668 domain-containing protein [Syntrophales bacterium]
MEKKRTMNIIVGGMVLICLGVLIILSHAGIFPFAKSWPVLLIVIGIGVLIQYVKDIGGWVILIVGLIYLIMETMEVKLEALWKYLMPVVLIVIGAGLLVQRKKK